MKWSRFNIIFLKNNEYHLYNTITGGLCKVNKCVYEQLEMIEKGRMEITSLDDDVFSFLKTSKYIVEENDDIDSIQQLRYLKLSKSFQKDRLSLVIAPTLFCNFACPYCYEKDLPNNHMNDEVINDLVSFIHSKEKDYKYLEICWHGGEPLSATPVIKKILALLKTHTQIELKGHSMVTNGSLINSNFFDCFKNNPLNYIQITIDGNEVSHNRNRVSKDGKPTYETILHNIDVLTQRLPLLRIGVRMNVHKNNKEEFIPLYKELSTRWKNSNVNIYPAFVMENSSCKVPCFNSVEKTTFLNEIYKKIGKRYSIANTKIKTGECTAIYENSFVIDPYGDIYKCWVDVGVSDMKIGNLKEGVTNYKNVEKYMLSSDKFSDKKCLGCKIFPICSGGCNKYRLDSDYNTNDICPLSIEQIPDLII